MSNQAAIAAEGVTLPWVNNSGGTKNLNDIVDLDGGLMGLLSAGATSEATTLAAAAEGQVIVQGVAKTAKEPLQAWRVGDELFWDSTNNQLTRFGWGIFRRVGVAARPAAETDAVGYVLLNAPKTFNDGYYFEYLEDFRGIKTPPATASAGDGNGWSIADTSSAGAPTLTTLNNDPGGAIKLLLANTSEAENLCLYHGDILTFDIDHDLVFQARFYVGANAASTDIVIGLGSARNDNPDTVAANMYFKIAAASLNLLVETDDGSVDDDDNDTTVDLVADTYVHVAIDCRDTSDVKFYVNGARVLSATTFDMSGYAGKLQPIVQVQKTAATDVPYAVVDFVRITGKRAA